MADYAQVKLILALAGKKRQNSRPFKASFELIIMKQGIHPEYRDVVFQDTSSDFAILTRSTIHSRETIKWEDGNEYPLVKLEVSSA
jgi:ribosomal protein L31